MRHAIRCSRKSRNHLTCSQERVGNRRAVVWLLRGIRPLRSRHLAEDQTVLGTFANMCRLRLNALIELLELAPVGTDQLAKCLLLEQYGKADRSIHRQVTGNDQHKGK